jgi:hypothetical protein
MNTTTYTLAVLAEEIATEVGEAASDPDVGFQFQSWVNEALSELWDQDRWPWASRIYQATIAGFGPLELLDTNDSLVGAVVRSVLLQIGSGDSGTRLQGTTRDALLRSGANLEQQGVPTHWYYDGLGADGPATIGADTYVAEPVIRVWPIAATGTVMIDCEIVPPHYAPTDTLVVPADAIRSLRENVRMRYYENARKLDSAAIHAQRWQDAVVALRRRYISSVEIDSRLSYRDVRPGGWPIPRFPNTIG